MDVFKLSDKTVRAILDEEVDLYDLIAGRDSITQEGEATLLQEMYDDVARDRCLHPDDDFEEILEIMLEQIEADYS